MDDILSGTSKLNVNKSRVNEQRLITRWVELLTATHSHFDS